MMGEVSLKSMGPEEANKSRLAMTQGWEQNASNGGNTERQKDAKDRAI